jgi:hypothetical protein
MLGEPRKPRAIILEVECGGETHRVRIEPDAKGRLLVVRMLDHDNQTVEAFAAFGANPPQCLTIARLWRHDPHWAASQLTPLARYATHVFCPSCGWEAEASVDLESISSFEDWESLDAQGPVPAGLCPECGGMVFYTFSAKER